MAWKDLQDSENPATADRSKGGGLKSLIVHGPDIASLATMYHMSVESIVHETMSLMVVSVDENVNPPMARRSLGIKGWTSSFAT